MRLSCFIGVTRVALCSLRVVRRASSILIIGLVALSNSFAHTLDANVASIAQLETLNGVGPRTAQLIVSERERGGHFDSLDDLSDRVRGIGKKRLARLRDAGLYVGRERVSPFNAGTIATPHFAPALPALTP